MGWASPLQLLREELKQRRDEGAKVPEQLRARIQNLDPRLDDWNEQRLAPLWAAIEELADDAELRSREPNELAAIREARPRGPRDLGWAPPDEEALDRFHGAWTGRCVGCALGKPLEIMGMGWRGDRFVGRAEIKAYLQARSDWPLQDFVSGRSVGDGRAVVCPRSQREYIAYMEADDDIHSTLIALGVLEEHGPGFSWSDVADYWLAHLPIDSICTAEAQAIENFQLHSDRRRDRRTVASPGFTRRYRNPYREWIGAQIRADGWAYVCAGNPELAAEFAYRDASWTHERNGLYGAMLFAAIQAAAFVESDPTRLVEIGLSEIPQECRLSRAVRQCLLWIPDCPDFESCVARVEIFCGDMSPVHTINNAMVCVLSLFYGRMHPTLTPQASPQRSA